jgi:NAD(P)-dependent dehydrogenase (short-subunit alcohol dehydrogenase family)
LDHEQLERLFADVKDAHGKLHVLWNHAGAPGPAGLEATEPAFDFAMDLNVKSAYFATALAEDLLAAADGKASVIFTSSVSGLVGSPGSPVYSLAKGGIATMTKSLAVALAPKGIRVNAICPAAVETPMLIKFFDRTIEDEEEAKEIQQGYIKASVPLGRAGTAEEIADVVAFLASDESSFITGVPLPVDGGYTAK